MVLTDLVAPVVEYTGNQASSTIKISAHIKRKMSLRRRLLKRLKETGDIVLNFRIKNLNYEIKKHFTIQKRNRVRKGIIPGNSKTLRKAIATAKDKNMEDLPKQMYLKMR